MIITNSTIKCRYLPYVCSSCFNKNIRTKFYGAKLTISRFSLLSLPLLLFYNIAIDAICNIVLIVVVGIVLVVVRISVTVAVGLIFYYHNAPHSEYSPFNLLGLCMVFS